MAVAEEGERVIDGHRQRQDVAARAGRGAAEKKAAEAGSNASIRKWPALIRIPFE